MGDITSKAAEEFIASSSKQHTNQNPTTANGGRQDLMVHIDKLNQKEFQNSPISKLDSGSESLFDKIDAPISEKVSNVVAVPANDAQIDCSKNVVKHQDMDGYIKEPTRLCPRSGSQCPVNHNSSSDDVKLVPGGQYDLDERNMMFPPNQTRSENQPFGLSTTRTVSPIPRSDVNPGEGEYWVYPSEQQFYNAMIRKGYELDKDPIQPQGPDFAHIINMHNANNNYVWECILKWEHLNDNDKCSSPKLKSFEGKSTQYTWSAWLKAHNIFSSYYGIWPFDRHDWVIERQNGNRVTYIIDYYDRAGRFEFFVRPSPSSSLYLWHNIKYKYEESRLTQWLRRNRPGLPKWLPLPSHPRTFFDNNLKKTREEEETPVPAIVTSGTFSVTAAGISGGNIEAPVITDNSHPA